MKTTLGIPSTAFAKTAAAFVLALFFAFAHDALAHARMVRSIPAKNAELTKSPGQIDLWFNELLDEGFNSVEVFPSAELTSKKHANLVKDKAAVDPADRTHLTIKIAPLSPGEYVVEWRVLSRDGHSAPGRITFHFVGTK